MKISLSLLCLAGLVAVCHSATVSRPGAKTTSLDLDAADDDVQLLEPDQNPDEERIKRAGGGNVINYISAKVSSGIKSGIQSVSSKIAGASTSFGAKGEDRGYSSHEYGPPAVVHDDATSKLDGIWSFKKSILQTLVQAVKAITGGVIGLSGQVAKGAGKAVEVKGRFLQSAGESIYDYGKHVSKKALQPLVIPHVSHAVVSHGHAAISHGHSGYEGPAPILHSSGYSSGGGASGYSGNIQSAPLIGEYNSYGASGPSDDYGAPHYQVARAAKPVPAAHNKASDGGVKAGLLVLKPISVQAQSPRSNAQSNNLYHAASSNYQSYVQAPVQRSRSYHVEPQMMMYYDPALGYNVPSIQYE